MPGVARVTLDNVSGGEQLGLQAPTVFVDNKNIVVLGDNVASHGLHGSTTMVEGSQTVFANNLAVCRQGDKAGCGDVTTGSEDVFAG